MTHKQKRNREEPSLDLTEELDVMEAFETCHTSSKKGLSEPAREALVSSVVSYLQYICIRSYEATWFIHLICYDCYPC